MIFATMAKNEAYWDNIIAAFLDGNATPIEVRELLAEAKVNPVLRGSCATWPDTLYLSCGYEDFAKLQKSNEPIGRIFTISVKRTTKDKKALFSSISCEHRRKKGQTYPVLFESCFPVWCLICSIAGRLRLPGRLCRTTGYAP